MVLRLLICIVVALGLHLTLGWLATILAGVIAGAWLVRRGWLWGAVVGLADWSVLVIYNFMVAPGPVSRMVETMGGLMGNLPGWVVVAVTLLIGAALGGIGGFLGASVMRLIQEHRERMNVHDSKVVG